MMGIDPDSCLELQYALPHGAFKGSTYKEGRRSTRCYKTQAKKRMVESLRSRREDIM